MHFYRWRLVIFQLNYIAITVGSKLKVGGGGYTD